MSARLESITVFPIKSCRGVQVDAADVVERGLARDRRYMLVDEAGRFVTQREEHGLARVDVEVVADGWTVSAPGQGSFALPASVADGAALVTEVWRSTLDARVVPEGSRWFSRFLGREIRLVYFPDESRREVEREPGSVVAFQDAYPFLVVSRESLEDLNRRLQTPLEMERFRPNLVVSGVEPYAEESWQRFRIGNVRFRGTRPCVRCVVTTLDPRSGSAGKEPLATLARYHTYEGKVSFGMNAVHELEGFTTPSPSALHVGDPLHLD
jgi:uncharacterized protein YcbX